MPVAESLLEAVARSETLRALPPAFDRLGVHVRGKVRENYVAPPRRCIITTDRVSAFDVVLGTVPFKGQLLQAMASYWFDVVADLVPHHVLAMPDPQAMWVVECSPIPVEIVVRGYLTGSSSTSILRAYESGAREFCGHRLADGLRPHAPLPTPLVTPTTKAAAGAHDENISADEVVRRGLLSRSDFEALEQLALRLFTRGQETAAARGLILVDTKYEFGRAPDGSTVLIDEVHTPDSSRYWYADGYEAAMARDEAPRALDKEFLRRWLVAQGYRGEGAPPELPIEIRTEAARRYIEAYELLTGQTFAPDPEPPLPRLARALAIELD